MAVLVLTQDLLQLHDTRVCANTMDGLRLLSAVVALFVKDLAVGAIGAMLVSHPRGFTERCMRCRALRVDDGKPGKLCGRWELSETKLAMPTEREKRGECE